MNQNVPQCSAIVVAQTLKTALEKPSSGHQGLDRVRAMNPGLMIIPFPNANRGYKLTANVPLSITLPDYTRFIMLSGDGVYYASRNGAAQVPASSTDDGSGSVMNPEYAFLYVEGMRQFSVISESAIHLTVHCFQ